MGGGGGCPPPPPTFYGGGGGGAGPPPRLGDLFELVINILKKFNDLRIHIDKLNKRLLFFCATFMAIMHFRASSFHTLLTCSGG